MEDAKFGNLSVRLR